MSSLFSLRGLLSARPAASTTSMTPTTTMTTRLPSNSSGSILARLFTTTSPQANKNANKKGAKAPGKSGGGGGSAGRKPPARRARGGPVRSEAYSRVRLLRMNLFITAPPPLRMARLRHLRHWTIHRAWLLLRRQQAEATAVERERISWGMYNACEELRRTVGPGPKGEGYLYRVAMEKKDVWDVDSVPIEYARLQTDTPPKQVWNHEWKR